MQCGMVPAAPATAPGRQAVLAEPCPQGVPGEPAGWGAALGRPRIRQSPSALAVPPPSGPQQQWLRFCCLRPPERPGDICRVQSSQHESLRKYACDGRKVAQNFQTSALETPAPVNEMGASLHAMKWGRSFAQSLLSWQELRLSENSEI